MTNHTDPTRTELIIETMGDRGMFQSECSADTVSALILELAGSSLSDEDIIDLVVKNFPEEVQP